MTSERSILRSSWSVLQFACSTEYFPLTLTLSLGEREQQASDWCLADGRWANSGAGVIERWGTLLPLPGGEGRGEGEPSVAHPTTQSVASGARLWSQTRHVALAGSVGDFRHAAAGASHAHVWSVMVGMARCAVPARVVAGGTNDRAALAFEGVAPLHAARTSQRDVPSTLNS